MDSLPLEMLFPDLAPGMKQLGDRACFRIDPGEICSFMKIAVDASKGEIIRCITAAMNSGNDVLDVKRGQRRIILMQVTILASVLRTLANLSPDLCADHL